MFSQDVYTRRRNDLKKLVPHGILLFPGNTESPMNYKANTYRFRQDSCFSYFFGLGDPDLFGIIDPDNQQDMIFGNELTLDDIIWMGPQPSLLSRASSAGIKTVQPLHTLSDYLQDVQNKKRKIHFLPPYRAETILQLASLLSVPVTEIEKNASMELIRAVISLRSVKDSYEIAETERVVNVAHEMHTTVMKLARPGVTEAYLTGIVEAIPIQHGGQISFPVILSKNGETLHNHVHHNTLKEGDLLITDAGAEGPLLYASDITRTTPVSGKFTPRQKDIYSIVLKANTDTIQRIKPGIPHLEIHLAAARTIAAGLKELGLMKGDMDEAVKQGAHALFFPHGLGHMLGMDVHDMEGLGENNVGYDDEIKRINQFGTAYLRLGKRLQPNYLLTVEPGIYFIPALIERWKSENKFKEFIHYAEVEKFIGFGGIRIEDNLLVTETGCRVLGNPIPKTIEEVEATANA